ncbi:LysR substrate-binding domain-containing protein [Enterobacter soli]|uniref:LysR substrate-binding domain-containing protein n=1 Tax=Enterobacter soli TaxID=885040 RepID=UPI003ED8BF10
MLTQQNQLALLHTFEISANYLSFTRAAEILCITQGAVSHRIRHLEELLGFRLFIRSTRQLALTDEGNRLLNVLSQSLRKINDEIEDIRDKELRGTLNLGLAPTFASLWLMPRLPAFHKDWPGLNINIRVRSGKTEFNLEDVDLALYYLRQVDSELHHEKISNEILFPVCSPDYYREVVLKKGVDECVFIHATESTDYQDIYSDWRYWCHKNDLTMPIKERFLSFNNFQMSVDAAKYGVGIAMGRKLMIQRYIDSGELICPFGNEIVSQYSYNIVYPKENIQKEKVKVFLGWFKDALGKDINFSHGDSHTL